MLKIPKRPVMSIAREGDVYKRQPQSEVQEENITKGETVGK